MGSSVISLKSSVFFSRFDEGVVFRGSETPVVFRGKRAYDLVGALLDRMERGTTRDQLLGALPDPVRPVAERLIGELQRNALLRERDSDDPAAEQGLAGRFANLWSYLADHHPRPGEALKRWQASRFAIGGEAEAAPYAVRALAECAAERIALVGRAAVESPALDAVRAEFPGLIVDLDPRGQAADADGIVIHAGGDRPFHAGDSPARNCWYFGLLAGHLCIALVDGPLDQAIPRWEARMRPPLAGWEQGRISGQRVALAAAAMAFGAFNRHAGIGGRADWSAPHLVEPSSQITPLRLPAEPSLAAAHSEAVADPDGVLFEEAVSTLFDPVTGLFEAVEDDLPQLPLATCAIRVFAYDRSEAGTVLGWGSSYGEARRRAVARGLVAYLRSVPAIGPRAASIAVGSSPGEALAAAEAARAGRSATLLPLPLSALTDADAVKLAKLLGLVTGTEPALTGWSSEDGRSASVAVHLEGQILAQANGAGLEKAAYLALGDACVTTQLAAAIGAGGSESWAAPDGAAAATGPALLLDTGFPSLAGHLFCAATGVAER